MSKFYNFKNEADKVVIDIDGIIGAWWDGSEQSKNTKSDIRDFLNELGENSDKNILVRISSPGGYVDDGLTILDALKNHPASVEVEITGMTASAATIISQAADKGKLKMSDNALFLAHRAMTGIYGNSKEMSAAVENLQTLDSVISNIYAKRSGRSVEDIDTIMDFDNGNGKWLTAEQAKEAGFVDEIIASDKTAKTEPENVKEKMFQNFYQKYAAIGIKVPVPDFSNSVENKVEGSMTEKMYTAAELEAAKQESFENGKKEAIENVSKHLKFLDKAEKETVLNNIKEGASFYDCVDGYTDEVMKKVEAEKRVEDMTPENLGHHNEADMLNVEGDEKKDVDKLEAAKNMGLI